MGRRARTLISIDEAASRLGVARSWVDHLIRHDRLQAYKLEDYHRTYVTAEDVELERQRREGSSPQ